ncbi:guanylate kinase isoform X2 [Bombus affinis]|nr:guanylate kinase isoform X2 [Bombus terrestris]XP_012164195.1 guanylate kinase isoform X2 [Bombus terrestris]XP_012164196.1 guanylate kinase isoform X2 [Bombus terrestris]XP_048261631.1 guanylate kinase isoform X2 [Bombus terrestris]XP_048261632.1 guanylate kinase isoform X2 [Bombus terrestris]XP_048261634.1 guanylate kinase isoform X2 [Bombus terrestris]XP_050589843.1 guanylate kinase isoform X2 [Bombus affinis]XP_050589844.1 guanylate kinase isoform X2 [Bombus affinis]XP_050589845.1 gu
MFHKGSRPLVLCGPSGSGKSTLLKKLFEEFPDTFGYSVSHTTRSPRPGEEDGKHYHFTTKDKMQKQIEQDEFLETATFSGNMYGTSKRAVEEVQKAGKICVLDVEVQGVKQIKQSSLDPLYIFIKAPSIEELEKRLRARKTETEDALQRRLSIARLEIEYGEKPGNFDIVIENDNVSKAYEKLRDFLMSNLKRGDAGH